MVQTQGTKVESELFPGEVRSSINAAPMLVYCRPGDASKPLVIFLTGGGVMARIAYGHPGGSTSDFLDYWLERKGWGLVAATYPGDHPAFIKPKSDLDLESWASALATVVAETVGQDKGRPIIALGWSMGGKLAFALPRALRLKGQQLECFVSLCATPPFPRTDDSSGPPERLASNGLWDLSAGTRDGLTRDQRWSEELAAIAKVEGHTVIDPDMFGRLYRTNVPPGLWGPELAPFFDEDVNSDLPGALRQACSFSGADYPICAAIIPTDSRDYRHALADEAVWGSITIKSVLHNVIPKLTPSQLSTHDWLRLRDRVVDLPRRLARYLPGGHFFFVGAHGARATVSHLEDLHDEIRSALALFGGFDRRVESK